MLNVVRAKFLGTFFGRYFTAGGHWYCSLNEVCYSEHYMEYTSQQVDTGIAVWMKCVTGNNLWEIFTAIGHCCCSLDEFIDIEQYMQTPQFQSTPIRYALFNILFVHIYWWTKWHLFVSLRSMSVHDTVLYGKYEFLQVG